MSSNNNDSKVFKKLYEVIERPMGEAQKLYIDDVREVFNLFKQKKITIGKATEILNNKVFNKGMQ